MFKSVPKSIWFGLLLAFIALDTAYTFWQNHQLPLDGDLVTIVLPEEKCVPIMNDPFGWSVITQDAHYSGTNRFFAHAAMTVYWKTMPFVLQLFTNPVNSLYVASALFNTGVQVGFMLLLAAYIRLSIGAQRSRWAYWVAAALLVPLFQTDGFNYQIGLTNSAITYTFFYGFPMMMLLGLVWPFYKAAYLQQPFRVPAWRAVLLVLLMVVLAFNGPIAMATVSVLLLGVGIYWLVRQVRMKPTADAPRTLATGWLSNQALGLLFIMGLLDLYSLYIGRNEAESTHIYTLWQLYKMLPGGIIFEGFGQWGLPVFVLMVVVNTWLVRWLLPPSPERDRVLFIMRAVGLFCVVFVALIPFGGFRNYRPNLIRGDITTPVTIALLLGFGVSAYYLLLHLRSRVRTGYLAVLLVAAVYYMHADAVLQMPNNNECERYALEQIADSPDEIVHLYVSCNILSWGLTYDYKMSEMNATMLQYWNVTDRKKLYFQQ
ncbi:hypothetical protein Q5H92_16405 [Hymenobacter sp. M29]|uniref:DUF2142 domain-containing protein n=1 Tax=Hymenobacter mellowenesis TaxID=3063995 RepID=A0ABT9ADM2_9BACT|nr:hypothetical protein [Hymenobacter sp. M29]MDO7847949.1 hypothetical protein [Hymenobacter sp. M29]